MWASALSGGRKLCMTNDRLRPGMRRMLHWRDVLCGCTAYNALSATVQAINAAVLVPHLVMGNVSITNSHSHTLPVTQPFDRLNTLMRICFLLKLF